MGKHLSDEQVLDLFLGMSLDAEGLAHLHSCEHCRREVEFTKAGVDGLNELGASWAETEAPRVIAAPVPRSMRSAIRLGFTWSLTALATCAIVIASIPQLHSFHVHEAEVVRAAPSAAEIQRDNAWLEAMDRDLRYSPELIDVPSQAHQPEFPRSKKQSDRVIAE